MKIFLYNPDDGLSYNFIPHLWMFLLKELASDDNDVIVADRKIQKMGEKEIAEFVLDNNFDLVGIGAMTRMISKAYKVADEVRKRGIKVVMGGPHVSVLPQEGLKHADAIAVGESDEFWNDIIRDAEKNNLKKIYRNPVDENGVERKPSLENYPVIRWDEISMDGFDSIPGVVKPVLKHFAKGWEKFFVIPIETQRGCPYGCEFCTVTRFFGSKIRYRPQENILEELEHIKNIEREGRGHVGVVFVDDNFAINRKRTKDLLREMIKRDIKLNYFAQISINLLKDDELVDLLSKSGCKMIFVGLESIDEESLKSVHKNQNNPLDYKKIIEKLVDKNMFIVASFIFGFDNDSLGIADRTFKHIKSWPPVLPVFGQLTPYPGTPLYDKLLEEERIDRPEHWLEVKPFVMAHKPLKATPEDVHRELKRAWMLCYSPETNKKSVEKIKDKSAGLQIFHLITRLMFRGIYYPQRSNLKWIKVLYNNKSSIKFLWRNLRKRRKHPCEKFNLNS